MSRGLQVPHTVDITYSRSVGGALERFFTGLARAEVWGSRGRNGRVAVPPVDDEPAVAVRDTGVVRSWTWAAEPRPEHPLDRPFAFALVQLDGADTALLHVVDVAAEEEMVTGMRVRADWRVVRTGSILDIRAFIPESSVTVTPSGPAGEFAGEVVTAQHTRYIYEPGLALSGFLRKLAEHRIEGWPMHRL